MTGVELNSGVRVRPGWYGPLFLIDLAGFQKLQMQCVQLRVYDDVVTSAKR